MTDQETKELVTLRDHFEELLKRQESATEQRWEAHYREQELRDKALKLQALEYERRMNNLNHEAERLAAAGKIVETLKENIHSAEKQIAVIEAAILAMVLAILGFVIQHFMK